MFFMAIVQLMDEVQVQDYLETMVGEIVNLGFVEYMDADDDIQSKVSKFFQNTRTNGQCVLFVGLYEGETNLGDGGESYTFDYVLTVLRNLPDQKNRSMLENRKVTRECLLGILGKIIADEDESRGEREDIGWEWQRNDESCVPTGEMGNMKAFGFTTSLRLVVDVGGVMAARVV